MELTIDGRRMTIDSVNFETGKVSLLDLDAKGWFPIFRSEPIPFVREFVEEVQQSEEYIAAEMAQLQEADQAPTAEPAPERANAVDVQESPETQGYVEADELDEAVRLIRDFCEAEYGQDDVDFSNMADIGIAYTRCV